jgi:tRNA (cmo5U34)-methyltransferase
MGLTVEGKAAIDLNRLFGRERSPDYDVDIRKRIPGYEALHASGRAILASALPESARVLVVGAGTGQELIAFAQAHPGWRLVGVDPSSGMLDIARDKVARAGVADRVELHLGTAGDLPPDAGFDAATALLVMHFIADDPDKLAFLVSIRARLRPGAPFLLADLCGVPGSPRFETLFAAWQSYLSANTGVSPDDETLRKEFAERRARPGWIDEARHLALFAAAGFREPTAFWAGLLFSGWTMRRA